MYDATFTIHRGCSEDVVIQVLKADGSPYTFTTGDAAALAISSARSPDTAVINIQLNWDSSISRWVGALSPAQTALLDPDTVYWMDAKLQSGSDSYPIMEMQAVEVLPINATISTS